MPNAAQRACIAQAAETQHRYPDWAVTWGLAGFGAHEGHTELGPATTAPALEALLHAETLKRRRAS